MTDSRERDEWKRIVEKKNDELLIQTARIRELEAQFKFALAAHEGQVEDKDTITGWLVKAQAERDNLLEAFRSEGSNRYWESRWRDVESERDTIKAAYDAQVEMNALLVNGADAIKAKTIEECAQAAEWFNNVIVWDCADIVARIRALNQQEKEDDSDLPTAMDVRGILKPSPETE